MLGIGGETLLPSASAQESSFGFVKGGNMKAKRLQLIAVVALALCMSLFTLSSTTYAQTTSATRGSDQDVVRVLEGNWQTLAPGAQHWYRFDYAGGNLPVRVSLDVNPAESAGFQVWTAAQFAQLAATTNVTPIASSTLDPADSTHIIWEGALTDPGIYYIVVQPSTMADAQYLLTIGGRGLAPATDGGAIVAGALNVNVRSGPSTAFAVIRTIAQGTQLTVLGQDASNTWLSVRLPDGTEGWIARFLTDFTGSASIVAAPALQQPALAPPATTATAPQAVGAFNVNVRSGPSTLYPVIRTVANGAQFTVLGQDASSAWLAVRFADGTEGWIARFLTDFTSTVAVVVAPPLAQPPLAPPSTVTRVPDTSAVPGTLGLPSQAAAIDNFPIEDALGRNWRVLGPGQTQWFTFTHPGDEAPMQIWMNSDPGGAADFRIFSEADAQAIMAGANPDDFVDIGRGTSNPNEPADLFWRGAFDEHGRYFVMITNGGTSNISYSIYGVGPSIGG